MDRRATRCGRCRWTDRSPSRTCRGTSTPRSRQGEGRLRRDARGDGRYEIDFRILHGEGVRWISARGQGDDKGIVERVMFGVFLDVTERKRAEEARELLTAR